MNEITMKMQADQLIRMAFRKILQARMFLQMRLCRQQQKEP